MEKAFDSIWIPGLIYKLIKYKIPCHIVILIYNMLSNKKFKVNHHKIESKTFNIINGLQQGTVNAPTLFNIYLVDLLNKIENIIAFADDILIYHPDAKIEQINQKLQDSFNIVEKYTLDWNMKINVEKCETILFRPPLDRCNNDVKRN